MPSLARRLRRALVALTGATLVAALPMVAPRPTGAAATPVLAPAPGSDAGYWLVGGDGSVYPFGAAADLGSLRAARPARPVVGVAATPSGRGYWLVASDGGVFSFGDAGFLGSTGSISLNQPIVGIAATPTGAGYWFVAADGGIFSFGDADFSGSTGDLHLNKPIVGMAATPTGAGYWFVASDGGVFNFGDADFSGSTGGRALPAGVVVMAASRPSGSGGDGGGAGDPTTTTAPPATGPTTPTSDPTATTAPPGAGQAFEIGLMGDTGYTAAEDGYLDNVIAQQNRFPLAFTIHDGDIKDPYTPCTDERDEEVKEQFNRSKAPFVYTPGDNEWMDCDNAGSHPNQQPMDSDGRLDELRELFFSNDTSLGVNRVPLTTQRQAGYPENARWTTGGVVFATINAPGPTDNLPAKHESGPRRVANLAWLQAAFDQAQATNAPAVMIIWQADPFQPTFGINDTQGYWGYLMNELKQRAIAFGKPVVLVHGDTHIHRLDNPWPDVPNFTRLETFGDNDTSNWVLATVNPSDPKVFSFANEHAG